MPTSRIGSNNKASGCWTRPLVFSVMKSRLQDDIKGFIPDIRQDVKEEMRQNLKILYPQDSVQAGPCGSIHYSPYISVRSLRS